LYAETEFHLTRLLGIDRLVEVGRACVRRDYRTGSVISLLWAGLLRYLLDGGHEFVVGCASIGIGDDMARVAALCRRLVLEHASPPEWRVLPPPAPPPVAPPAGAPPPVPA